jgi:hypothetical protein
MTELLKLNEESSVGDSLSLDYHIGQGLYLTVENTWSGDTETGFGSDCCVKLTKQHALELAGALLAWANE